MRLKLAIAVIAAIISAAIIVATAAHAGDDITAFKTFDGSELNGSPYVAVLNHKDVGIKSLTCPGFWGTHAQNIPGGVIDPKEVTIIKFGASKCDTNIEVEFVDGHKTTIVGFDTSKNVILNVK